MARVVRRVLALRTARRPAGEYACPSFDVTLAELASHRSGLPSQAMRLQDEFPLVVRALTHRDLFIQDVEGVIAQARTATLTDRGHVAYSNLGAALLGHALASASHMDYARLVQERIFTPLGMTGSSVPVSAGNLPAAASTGYSAAGKGEAPWTLNGWAPTGGIRSTPADMVRYAQALLDGSAPGIDALTPRWESGGQRVRRTQQVYTLASKNAITAGGWERGRSPGRSGRFPHPGASALDGGPAWPAGSPPPPCRTSRRRRREIGSCC